MAAPPSVITARPSAAEPSYQPAASRPRSVIACIMTRPTDLGPPTKAAWTPSWPGPLVLAVLTAHARAFAT